MLEVRYTFVVFLLTLKGNEYVYKNSFLMLASSPHPLGGLMLRGRVADLQSISIAQEIVFCRG